MRTRILVLALGIAAPAAPYWLEAAAELTAMATNSTALHTGRSAIPDCLSSQQDVRDVADRPRRSAVSCHDSQRTRVVSRHLAAIRGGRKLAP